MAKATFAGQQKPFRREMLERWLHALADELVGFNHVTPLVDNTESEIPSELP